MKFLNPEQLTAFIQAPDCADWLIVLAQLKEPIRSAVLHHAAALVPPSAPTARLRAGTLLSETVEGRIHERKFRGEIPFAIAQAEGVPLQTVYDTLGIKRTASPRAEDAAAGNSAQPRKRRKQYLRWGEVPESERDAIKAEIAIYLNANRDTTYIGSRVGLPTKVISDYVSKYRTKIAPDTVKQVPPGPPKSKRGYKAVNGQYGRDRVNLIIQIRMLGVANKLISQKLGVARQAVDNAVWAGRKAGAVFPSIDPELALTDDMLAQARALVEGGTTHPHERVETIRPLALADGTGAPAA